MVRISLPNHPRDLLTLRAPRSLGVAGTALFLLGAAACGNGAGPSGTGTASVELSQAGGVLGTISGRLLRLDATPGQVPLGAISALQLTLERIDVHRSSPGAGSASSGNGSGNGSSGEGGWITLNLTEPLPIDVLSLPTAAGVEVARGDLPAGQYDNLRLFFSQATLTLSQTLDVQGQTFDPGEYDLRIPSAEQTGLKVPSASFQIAEGQTETVIVEIATDASVQTIVRNANGFQMSPVLTASGS